jgi:hypothetical protein
MTFIFKQAFRNTKFIYHKKIKINVLEKIVRKNYNINLFTVRKTDIEK